MAGALFLSSPSAQGDALSILAALLWASTVVCFKLGGEGMPAWHQNFLKSSLGALLFTLTLLVLGEPFFPPGADGTAWALVLLSGFLGMSLADTAYFQALKMLGATLTSLVGSLYSPLMILFSVLFLGEELTFSLLLGSFLVVAGIVVGTWEPSRVEEEEEGKTRREILAGVVLGITFITLVVGSIIMIGRILKTYSPLWVAWLRISAGAVGILAIPWGRKGEGISRAFLPTRHTGLMIAGAVLGTWLGYYVWLKGLQLIPMSRASVLNELSLIFVFVLAALFAGERFTLRKAMAVGLAFCGSLLVLTAG